MFTKYNGQWETPLQKPRYINDEWVRVIQDFEKSPIHDNPFLLYCQYSPTYHIVFAVAQYTGVGNTGVKYRVRKVATGREYDNLQAAVEFFQQMRPELIEKITDIYHHHTGKQEYMEQD